MCHMQDKGHLQNWFATLLVKILGKFFFLHILIVFIMT